MHSTCCVINMKYHSEHSQVTNKNQVIIILFTGLQTFTEIHIWIRIITAASEMAKGTLKPPLSDQIWSLHFYIYVHVTKTSFFLQGSLTLHHVNTFTNSVMWWCQVRPTTSLLYSSSLTRTSTWRWFSSSRHRLLHTSVASASSNFPEDLHLCLLVVAWKEEICQM